MENRNISRLIFFDSAQEERPYIFKYLNKIFAFGQAITDASIGVLRSTLQGSQASLPQKLQAGIAASNGELNPSLIKGIVSYSR